MLTGIFMKAFLPYLLLSLSTGLYASDFSPQARDAELMTRLHKANQSLAINDKALKYCKMQSDVYLFYRGTNHLFWQDWYQHPSLKRFSNPKTQIWLQADLHADNFGAYGDSQGQVIYDLNDFDESFIADYQYDTLRMATSLYLIVEGNDKLEDADAAVDAFSSSYFKQLQKLRDDNAETRLVFTKDNTKGKLDNFLKKVEKKQSQKKMLAEWANKNSFRIKDNADLEAVDVKTAKSLTKILAEYKVLDVAKRLNAGTGSLGTARYYVLIDDAGVKRILDVKQQSKVAAYPYLDSKSKVGYDERYPNPAKRHAQAYRALTNNTDKFLGAIHWQGGDYSIRERSAYKKTFKTIELKKDKDFVKMAQQWGKILATAHARADKDAKDGMINYSFETQVSEQATNLKAVQKQWRNSAKAYAKQVQFDYKAFLQAYQGNCDNSDH